MRKLILVSPIFTILLCSTIIGQVAESSVPHISVPDINGRAISLIKPDFPETAVAAAADGASVSLKVVVDENGNVISATCSLNCHPMLKDAAELAAATSKFKPFMLDGKAVKYDGILLYTFVIDRVEWYRFGTALESARQFDNISLGPVAQILSSRFAEERKRLLSLDAKGIDLETRWASIREVEALLQEKLKDGDLWRFKIGMGLRRITFWTMAGEKTDRALLQKAIDDLPKLIESAPEDIPEETIAALTLISKYRVPTDLPEREMRQAIYNMARIVRIQP